MNLREMIRKNKFLRNFAKTIHFNLVIAKNVFVWLFMIAFFPRLRRRMHEKISYIYGWYGTETAGDKLILLGILYQLYAKYPSRKVEILSMRPDVTSSSVREILQSLAEYSNRLDLIDFISTSVSVQPERSVLSIAKGDTLILGGGPIMDDPILAKWLIFSTYSKFKKAAPIILGNGVGPLRKATSVQLSRLLFKSCSSVLLRNLPPKRLKLEMSKYKISLDPAFICAEVFNQSETGPRNTYNPILSVNSRSIPSEYVSTMAAPDEIVAQETSLYVSHILKAVKGSGHISLMPFSTHEDGSIKDSEMSQAVIKKVIRKDLYIKNIDFLGGDLLSALRTAHMSTYVVTTRFHGMVIALISGCEVAALDYSDSDGKSALFYQSLSLQSPRSKAFKFVDACLSDFISISNNKLGDKLKLINQDYQDALS